MNDKAGDSLKETELAVRETLQKSIELVLFSPYNKGRRFVGLLMVAEPESGKKDPMQKYKNNRRESCPKISKRRKVK